MKTRVPTILLAAALSACDSAPAPTAAQNNKPAANKDTAKPAPKADETSSESAPVLEYSYSPVGKRDPFRSVLEDLLKSGAEDNANVQPNCGPLCKWEIEQLRLVAVISGISNPLGMVEDPSGKGYVVRRGTFIGKRNGKVTQIRAGEVVVTEIFKDQMGKPHVNPVIIKLPADKNEQQEDQNLLGPEAAE